MAGNRINNSSANVREGDWVSREWMSFWQHQDQWFLQKALHTQTWLMMAEQSNADINLFVMQSLNLLSCCHFMQSQFYYSRAVLRKTRQKKSLRLPYTFAESAKPIANWPAHPAQSIWVTAWSRLLIALTHQVGHSKKHLPASGTCRFVRSNEEAAPSSSSKSQIATGWGRVGNAQPSAALTKHHSSSATAMNRWMQ